DGGSSAAECRTLEEVGPEKGPTPRPQAAKKSDGGELLPDVGVGCAPDPNASEEECDTSGQTQEAQELSEPRREILGLSQGGAHGGTLSPEFIPVPVSKAL